MDPMLREATMPLFALVDAVILEDTGRNTRVGCLSMTGEEKALIGNGSTSSFVRKRN